MDIAEESKKLRTEAEVLEDTFSTKSAREREDEEKKRKEEERSEK